MIDDLKWQKVLEIVEVNSAQISLLLESRKFESGSLGGSEI